MTAPKIPVWLDCDPGHDDAFAILLAAYHPGLRLLGISTVFGNASLDKTTFNATSVLTAIAKHDTISVYPGATKALVRPPIHAPTDIHGESGLDGTTLLPRPLVPARRSPPAIDAMAAALLAEPPGTAWVVATGACTNVAALLQAHPQVAPHLAGVSIMGGAIGGGFSDAVLGKVNEVERIGNWSQFAEFNILIDPEAATAVLGHPLLKDKTTMVPLDLTHQVLATDEVRDLLLYGPGGDRSAGAKTELRTMLVELLMFFAKTYSDVFGITAGPPLHDPLAVAAVLSGTEYEVPFYDWDVRKKDGKVVKERFEVSVVTEGTYEDARAGAQTGRTTARPLPPGADGVRIPRGLNIPRFWEIIEQCIQRADEANAALVASGAAKTAGA